MTCGDRDVEPLAGRREPVPEVAKHGVVEGRAAKDDHGIAQGVRVKDKGGCVAIAGWGHKGGIGVYEGHGPCPGVEGIYDDVRVCGA